MLICLSGCASVVNGTNQKVPVSSNPSGAKVWADDVGPFETPTILKLKRKRDHLLVFKKDGYEEEQRLVMNEVSWAVLGNIVIGGLPGLGIDAITGGLYKLYPTVVHVDLDPVKGRLSAEDRLKRLDEFYGLGKVTKEEYEAMRQSIAKSLW